LRTSAFARFSRSSGASRSDLVEHEPARAIEQLRIEFLELCLDRAYLLDRIDIVDLRRDIDDMQQQARRAHVLEELDAESRRLRPRPRSGPGCRQSRSSDRCRCARHPDAAAVS
jgi:hypothetical protein